MLFLAGLGLMVNWLSDPDNLNQLVVNQLDIVALKSFAEELQASDPDRVSVASQEGEGDEEGSEVWVAVISAPHWSDRVLVRLKKEESAAAAAICV